MATREIKTRFKLEGESEYNSAMSRVASSVKVLSSEQKLAKAQFEATGDKQKYAAEQARILGEKIEQQKKAVEAAEQALKKLKSYGLEPSDQLTQKWTTKLNNAQTSLQNMENQLAGMNSDPGETSGKMEQAGDAAGELDGALKDVGKGITLQNAVSAIDNITGHIESVIATAGRAAKALWDMGASAGEWADDVKTRSSELGIDTETLQSWQYASRFVDTSVDDIVKSWQDIDKKLKDPGSQTSLDWMSRLAEMGIATMDTAGKMRTSQDIFWDAVDYLHGIGDEAEKAQKATLLFGNDWRKLNPLIDEGSEAYKEWAEKGREVATVSNENVDALGSVDDAIQDFFARFDKLKYDSLAALAPTFEKVAEAMSTAVTALDEFVQSEEGQEALANLNEALSGVIDSFLGEDNGKGTFEGIVGWAKVAVEGLTGALQWIKDNGDIVAKSIEGLGIALGGLKVAKEVLLFMALVRAAGGGLGSLLGGGAKAGGAAAARGGADAAGGGAAAGGKSIVSAVGSFFKGLPEAMRATGPMAAIAALFEGIDAVGDKLRTEEDARVEEQYEATQALIEASGQMGGAADKVSQIVRDAQISDAGFSDFMGNAGYDPLKVTQALAQIGGDDALMGVLSGKSRALMERFMERGLSPQMQEKLLTGIGQDAEAYAAAPEAVAGFQSIAEATQAISEAMQGADSSGFGDLIDKIAGSGSLYGSLGEDTRTLIGQYFDEDSGFAMFSSVEDLLAQIQSDLEGAAEQAQTEGANLTTGYSTAIADNAGEAAEASAEMAQGAVDAANAEGEFFTMGANAIIGFVNGVYSRMSDVVNAISQVIGIAEPTGAEVLDSHSPSRVFERLGAYTGQGFALGIEESTADVERAVDKMAGATQRPVQPMRISAAGAYGAEAQSSGGAAQARGTDETGRVHVTMMIDKRVLGEVEAPIINDIIGAKIEATRR